MNPKFFIVGGAVRDVLLGRPAKDIDTVVVGATPDEMFARGFQQVGADFPVFLDSHGNEFALARTERKSGKGYHGFETVYDTSVTLEDDLLRRDLTINAMAVLDSDWEEFVNTKNPALVIDPFNGMADLKAGVLKHVSAAFAEDPLRVLRVARFAARYDFTVDGETLKLMAKLVKDGELDDLTPERVYSEFERALMENFPLNYFKVLTVVGAEVEFVDFARPLNVAESLDRAVLLEMDFFSRLIILVSPLKREDALRLLSDMKAPNAAMSLIRMSNTLIDTLMSRAFEGRAEQYVDVLDEMNAWRLPEVFVKVMQSLVTFDNTFIQKSAFTLLKLHREGSKANFDMLSDEQKATLKGKEIGEAISQLRRKMMLELG